MGFIIVYMFVAMLVMIVLGAEKYYLNNNLNIKRRFVDRFFAFASIILSAFLMAVLLLNSEVLMNWFAKQSGGSDNTAFWGAWLAVLVITLLYGVVLYFVGKISSSLCKRDLQEKRMWLRMLDAALVDCD